MAAPRSTARASLLTWDTLGRDEQLALLVKLCTARAAEFRRKFDGVLTLGVGYKTQGGERTKALCLAFLVKDKKDKVGRPVPETIVAFIERGGRRLRVYVPTDLEELGDGGPHVNANLASGILAAGLPNPAVRCTGAVCCLVRQIDAPSNVYALGCHHVLTLSAQTQGCAALVSEVISNDLPSQPVAQLFEYLPMSPNVRSCHDAAIALLDSSVNATWLHSGRRPLRTETAAHEPPGCRIYAPRGVLPASYVKTWIDVPLFYPNCGWVYIARTYQFQADTLPGDSGSAVMSDDGTLYGMHFWGQSSNRLSMAIPAATLFSPGLFSIDFDLA